MHRVHTFCVALLLTAYQNLENPQTEDALYNRLGIWQSGNLADDEPHVERVDSKSVIAPTSESPEGTYISIPLETIPTDIPLPCGLYVRISEKFVLFRKAGDVLTQSRAKSLIGPSNGVLFISLLEWNRLLHSLEAILIAATQVVGTHPTPPIERAMHIRNLLVAYGREIERRKDFNNELLEKIRVLGEQLATVIYESADLSTQLLRRYQEPGLYYINHAVNVAIYAVAIAKKQGLPLSSIKMLAFAALVHNIGNIMVPPEVLYKTGELTPEEKNTVDTHILHGASMLQSMIAPKDVVLTAMQHHDRYDGMGLAGRGGGSEIHLFARICTIADVFDALTSVRPYKPSVAPLEAIKAMLEMRGKFDPSILTMVADDKDKKS